MKNAIILSMIIFFVFVPSFAEKPNDVLFQMKQLGYEIDMEIEARPNERDIFVSMYVIRARIGPLYFEVWDANFDKARERLLLQQAEWISALFNGGEGIPIPQPRPELPIP